MISPSQRKILFILALVLCAFPFISAPIALVGGFLFTLIFGHPFERLGHKATSILLKVSVVGLGFGMNAHKALEAGRDGLWLTIASITLILTMGYLLGRWMNIDRKLSHLISSGTAICGGSAIAAIAPTVDADSREISMSLGVVFLLNSVALILFPIIGHALDLTQHQFGLWSAIAIHDTSSVVGASSAYGTQALEIATTVKLARALWIIPLSIISTLIFRSSTRRISIPWFIGLFILTMMANTFMPIVSEVSPYLYTISKSMLVVTLFLIGSSLSISSIRAVGLKPLALGVMLWIVISVLSLLAIIHL